MDELELQLWLPSQENYDKNWYLLNNISFSKAAMCPNKSPNKNPNQENCDKPIRLYVNVVHLHSVIGPFR